MDILKIEECEIKHNLGADLQDAFDAVFVAAKLLDSNIKINHDKHSSEMDLMLNYPLTLTIYWDNSTNELSAVWFYDPVTTIVEMGLYNEVPITREGMDKIIQTIYAHLD